MGRVSAKFVLFLPAAAICLTVAPLSAGSPEAEPVRLYTNADLPAPEVSSVEATPPTEQEADWEFVVDFISREHERLKAERAHALERRLVTLAEDRQADPPRYRGHLAGGYLGYPYRDSRHGGRGHARPGQRRELVSRQGGIVPLHARPSNAQVQRANAMRHSGRDAVPQRSGR